MENNEPTGEHFSPLKTALPDIELNLERYLFAAKQAAGKVVLDLGCGAGFGTYLYSMVASKVYAVDYSDDALAHAKSFPYVPGRVEFIKADFSDPAQVAALPAHDLTVALEILEHLKDPTIVLSALKGSEIAFSVPLYSMEVSKFHLYRIDQEDDVSKLISPFYQISRSLEQRHPKSRGAWILGEGVRLRQ